MKRGALIGTGLFTAGLVGYIAGMYLPYPGRAFSVTAVMIGIALVVITHQSTGEGAA